MNKIGILTAITAILSPLAAAEISFTEPESWSASKDDLEFKNGRIIINNPGIYVGKIVHFKKGCSYRFTGAYRLEKPSSNMMIEFALAPYGEKGRISQNHVSPVSGTDTVLISPVEKGETVLRIANGEKWKNSKQIMFATKSDFSDLPNYTANSYGITNIRQKDGKWEVALSKPVQHAYPANTGVRQSENAGYFEIYSRGFHKTNEWNSFDVMFFDISKNGAEEGKFWPGMRSAQPILYIKSTNSKGEPQKIEIKDFKMEETSTMPESNRKITLRNTDSSRMVAQQKTFRADWAVQNFLGRNFWPIMPIAFYRPPNGKQEEYTRSLRKSLYYPLKDLPPEMKKYLDIPAFNDVAVQTPYFSFMIRNQDGSCQFDLKSVTGGEPPADKPFFASPMRFTRPYREDTAHFFYFGKYEHNMELYRDWKKNHPNFAAVTSLSEWGNEAHIFYNFNRFPRFAKQCGFTEQEAAEIRKRFPEVLPDREAYINHRLKPFFERIQEIWYGDAKALLALEGNWCINHLAAYWGVGMVTMETSRSFANWQVQLMFNRGAARQFDIPWGWYVASYLTAYSSQGKWVTDSEPAAFRKAENWGPECGLSMSARERVFYMAYLAGANYFQREDTDSNFWDASKPAFQCWEPAEEAKVYIQFHNFIRKFQDRGVPYTPIAFLVPKDRGSCREIAKAFNRYPYLRSDNMVDGFIATLFPQEPVLPLLKKGVEITLRNSKYGDVFDVLTPDFEKQEAFKRTLPLYKVAILLGRYRKSPEMAEILRKYVADGGTLILNVSQLSSDFPSDFTGVRYNGDDFLSGNYRFGKIETCGASVIATDEKNFPVFTQYRYGKGNVIVGTPHDLIPSFDETDPVAGDIVLGETKSGARKFVFIEYLLDQLVKEVLPVTVEGDVQYGLNKTESGWWLYLFNNKGIIKFTNTPEAFDFSKQATVTVNLKKLNPQNVKNLLSEETIPLKNGVFHVSLDPGKFAIYEIRVK